MKLQVWFLLVIYIIHRWSVLGLSSELSLCVFTSQFTSKHQKLKNYNLVSHNSFLLQGINQPYNIAFPW